MAVLLYAIAALVLIIILWGLRLVFEYQRLVRFRLGRFKDVIEPGLKWVIPIIDKTQRLDLRVSTVDVEPQEAMTADNVPLKVQEIELPETMKRVMAKQAEAERERRATIIKSEGEIKAAENLAKAAQILGKDPTAFNLRTLSTIADISTDPSQKIIFVPADIMKVFNKDK
ncbi:MAG: SPFH domain-containing protein [Candidatus Woesearchaeota archaeon]|nr:SPFH domain-containing protein [Candidatus Woesearchaeota archaeon]